MKERNKDLLTQAILQLPEYEPKENSWDAIQLQLNKEQQESGLKETIGSLATYDPPALVWDNIQSELDKERKPKVRRLVWQNLVVAASILMTISIGLWYLFDINENTEMVTVTYSEELIAAEFLEVDWEEDEADFLIVEEFCKTDHIICKQPEFIILKQELEELTAAKEALKVAMENYGNDPELIAQLTSIEHERSDLLKKIVKKI